MQNLDPRNLHPYALADQVPNIPAPNSQLGGQILPSANPLQQYFTGIEILVPTPLIDNLDTPLFFVHTDARNMPGYLSDPLQFGTDSDSDWFFPWFFSHMVGLPNRGLTDAPPIKVLDKQAPCPALFKMLNYRKTRGCLGLTFHISSNTGVSGKLRFLAYKDRMFSLNCRDWKRYRMDATRKNFAFQGWSCEPPLSKRSLQMAGSLTCDLSLNRIVSIEAGTNSEANYVDNHFYWSELYGIGRIAQDSATPISDTRNIMNMMILTNKVHYMTRRSGVAVFIDGGIASDPAGEVRILIDADWTNVEFVEPITRPFLPWKRPYVSSRGESPPVVTLSKYYVWPYPKSAVFEILDRVSSLAFESSDEVLEVDS